MASSNLIKQLQSGAGSPVTDEEALAERLAQGPIALYCGFDPTADSLRGASCSIVMPETLPAGRPQACGAGGRRDRSNWRPELQSR